MRARRAEQAGAWTDALDAFASADSQTDLGADDLEAMARSAYMRGRDEDYCAALERAYHTHLRAHQVARAARCCWWLGHSLLFRGDPVRAEGWFAVGRRLLDEASLDCAERGYLLAATWLRQMGSGDWAAGLATAEQGERIGQRFDDPDLVWLARDEQARALVGLGRLEEGLRLVDELLVVVGSGALSPVVSGIVYCNTIAFCRDALALRHTREWTSGLTRWCAGQPQMVTHNGLCLVHRAEILQLEGDWRGALEEAALAAERFTAGALNQIALGRAHYRAGEIHRLRGHLGRAEAAYREASRHGYEPAPGLALLRLAQGRGDAAAASIRRAVTEHVDPSARAELLPAYVEIMVDVGELEAARSACAELDGLAAQRGLDALQALAHQARARVAVVEGDGRGGLSEARRAWRLWQELGAVYEAAQARVLVARACGLLGDAESEQLESAAARDVFVALGASAPDGRDTAGLSARELDVLRKVDEGLGNRDVAAALVISEHTVARHLQNIYAKLDVSTRTAALARGHDLGLL